MGAGVLPVTVLEGEPFLLFSRERAGTRRRDAGCYSSFGGGTERGENKLMTAAREFAEESSGFLTPSGPSSDMETRIKEAKELISNNCVAIITTNCYTEYVVAIPYDPTLVRRFREHFDEVKKTEPGLLDKPGMYEKDRLQWIRASSLNGRGRCVLETCPDSKGKKLWFRPWYWGTGIPRRSARVVTSWAIQKKNEKRKVSSGQASSSASSSPRS